MALSFVDIPLELLPIIFDSVVRAQHLAFLCLVNKSFHEFAIPRLYKRVYIYAWHTKAKAKVNTILAMFITVAHIQNRSFCCSKHFRVVLVLHITFRVSVSPDQIMTPTSALTNPVIHRDKSLSKSTLFFVLQRPPRSLHKRDTELRQPEIVCLDSRWLAGIDNSPSSPAMPPT